MSPLPSGLRSPTGDSVTPWFKKARVIAGGFVAIVAAISIGLAGLAWGAEKFLFYKALPETMKVMTRDLKIIKRVVCRAHPEIPCEVAK